MASEKRVYAAFRFASAKWLRPEDIRAPTRRCRGSAGEEEEEEAE